MANYHFDEILNNRIETLLHGVFLTRVIGSFVDGAIVEGKGEIVNLVNPANGKIFARYNDADSGLVDAAMCAAEKAQKKWAALTASARGRIIYEIGTKIRQYSDLIAEIESRSAGRPIRDIRGEALKVAEMFEYYAGWADKLEGRVIPVPTSHMNYTRREPVGVVVQITPWNAPLFTAGWQIAPAICAGNAVVIKPSELTPLSTLILGYLCEQAGAPKGLVNVVAGQGPTAGQAAITNSKAALVVFVGSAQAGAMIASTAAKHVVPSILELGGKSANIVFEDAEIDRAILGAQAAIFGGAGQSCVAGSRLLVHRSIHEKFIEKYAAGSKNIPIGDPYDDKTQIGPINNQRQWTKIADMVNEGRKEGAELVTGGSCPDALKETGGFYYAPTILDHVKPEMMIAREEVFGPVVVVTPFDCEEEAVALANNNAYGLAGAVWTQNVARAHRVAAQVRAGTFWINSYKTINVMSPFGGFGKSGYGRSSGYECLLSYTQIKSVWVETAANPAVSFGYMAHE